MTLSMILAAGTDYVNSYTLIIAASLIVVLSYFFNVIAKETNIPSVLMLIITGILIKLGLEHFHIPELNLFPTLELLGIVGLIMIVLEAALDLDISRDKLPIIGKATMVALLGLLGSAFTAAMTIQYFLDVDFNHALLYATPLSILSSAIIIPSVGRLRDDKKEFMVYEGTISDILGIMMFYLILTIIESGSLKSAGADFGVSLFLTILVSIVASYLLVLLFQNITTQVKLFLLIAVLLLLYSAGKLLHLSPLLLILSFGIVFTNPKLFFVGPIKDWVDEETLGIIEKEFHIVTIEMAFIVRTFFFVVFGMTITLSSILNWNVMIISMLIIILLYVVRVILLRIFVGKDLLPELYIAPRGLITILLFYAIPKSAQLDNFDSGILLFIILITSFVMTFGLVAHGEDRSKQFIDLSPDEPEGANDSELTTTVDPLDSAQ